QAWSDRREIHPSLEVSSGGQSDRVDAEIGPAFQGTPAGAVRVRIVPGPEAQASGRPGGQRPGPVDIPEFRRSIELNRIRHVASVVSVRKPERNVVDSEVR